MTLRIPPYDAVARYLESEGIDPAMAGVRRAGGAGSHRPGPPARRRRRGRPPAPRVLELPTQVIRIGGCFAAAATWSRPPRTEATAVTGELDGDEKAALRDLDRRYRRARRDPAARRRRRDRRPREAPAVTRHPHPARRAGPGLDDLAAFYRDVLVVQLGADVDLVNADLRRTLDAAGGRLVAGGDASPDRGGARRREAIDANVAPLLAVEAMAVALHAA